MGESKDKMLKAIKHYQDSLEKHTKTGRSDKLLHAMEKLSQLPIRVWHLEETGVGRTVNGLKKFEGVVGDGARTLVDKWKSMVKVEQEDELASSKHEEKEPTEPLVEQQQELLPIIEQNGSKHNSYSTIITSNKLDNNSSKKYEKNEKSYARNADKGVKRKKSDDSEDSGSDYRQKKQKTYDSSAKSEESESSSDLSSKKVSKNNVSSAEEESSDENSSDSDNNSDSSRNDISVKKSSTNKCMDTSSKSSKKFSSSSDESEPEKYRPKIKESTEKLKKLPEAEKSPVKSSKSKESSSDKLRDSKSGKHRESSSKKSTTSSSESEHRKNRHDSSKSRDSSKSSKQQEKEKHHNREESSKKSKSSSSRHHHHRDDEKRNKSLNSKSSKDRDQDSNACITKTKETNTQKSDKPKKIILSENSDKLIEGIDSESGTSFADVLGMLEIPIQKSKRRNNYPAASAELKSMEKVSVVEKTNKKESSSSSTIISSTSKSRSSEKFNNINNNNNNSIKNSKEVPTLLKDSKALEPLELNVTSLLPSLTPNYKPLGFPLDHYSGRKMWPDDTEALNKAIYAKHQRTKVYSGNKVSYTKVPSLFDICTRILQDNLDALEYTGGVPYTILKPILERANPNQLYQLEFHNAYLIEDTDELWQLHCQKEFRTKERQEMESWRDMYLRCLDEREAKLKALTANIKQSQDNSLPVRQTKLAYVDSFVKPPRNIAKKQAKNGIEINKRPAVTPTDRLNQLAKSGEAGKIQVPNPGKAVLERNSSSSSSSLKPKKAPLMAKTLSLLKNRFGRR